MWKNTLSPVNKKIELSFLHRNIVICAIPCITRKRIVPCAVMRQLNTNSLISGTEVSEKGHIGSIGRFDEEISSRPVVYRHIPPELGTCIIEVSVLLTECQKFAVCIV